MTSAPTQPSEVILEHMDRRRWKIADLARAVAAMEEREPASKELIFDIYIRDKEHTQILGPVLCGQLDRAFELPKDTFLKLEKAWCEHAGVSAT